MKKIMQVKIPKVYPTPLKTNEELSGDRFTYFKDKIEKIKTLLKDEKIKRTKGSLCKGNT